MQFNSLEFLLFFPAVVAVYFVIPKKLRKFWLLAASYYFYMSWNAKYAVLILTSTVITFYCGCLLDDSVVGKISKEDKEDDVGKQKDKADRTAEKKRIVAVCIALNLAILILFKYGNFTIDILNDLLSLLHLTPVQRRFDFILPVGISFYTFQALGYIIDIYRGETKAETNFTRYALFVSFFPQLVAGPIERSKGLLQQMRSLEEMHLWDAGRVTSGAILMVWGFFMKMVIADRAAILADNVFNNYAMHAGASLVTATLAFTLQIYCDFASYSMIAIGAARIMGFTLMENFNAPYLSGSIREFWRCWHISLTSWFRDYVYIPLGGNRKGTRRKHINVMIVFLLSGLWHGAGWNYIFWGGLHGGYLVAEDMSLPLREKAKKKLNINTECFSWRLLQTIITFTLVSFAWIFFRLKSLPDAFYFIYRIFTKFNPWLLFNNGLYDLGLDRAQANILIVAVVMLILVDLLRKVKGITLDTFLFSQNIWFEWCVIIILILMILTFGEYGPSFDPKQFIYFQF